ncbi:MAG: hypothetical protein ACXW30_05890 [Micavibrio sp.]
MSSKNPFEDFLGKTPPDIEFKRLSKKENFQKNAAYVLNHFSDADVIFFSDSDHYQIMLSEFFLSPELAEVFVSLGVKFIFAENYTTSHQSVIDAAAEKNISYEMFSFIARLFSSSDLHERDQIRLDRLYYELIERITANHIKLVALNDYEGHKNADIMNFHVEKIIKGFVKFLIDNPNIYNNSVQLARGSDSKDSVNLGGLNKSADTIFDRYVRTFHPDSRKVLNSFKHKSDLERNVQKRYDEDIHVADKIHRVVQLKNKAVIMYGKGHTYHRGLGGGIDYHLRNLNYKVQVVHLEMKPEYRTPPCNIYIDETLPHQEIAFYFDNE